MASRSRRFRSLSSTRTPRPSRLTSIVPPDFATRTRGHRRRAEASRERRLPPGRASGTMGVHSTQDARLAEKTTSHSLAVVVLAAGKGKRFRSSVPKVLHPVAGRPLLWHVLQTARVARPSKIVIVVGHGADD